MQTHLFPYPIRRIYIDPSVADKAPTLEILQNFSDIPRKVGPAAKVFADINQSPDPIQAGKQILFLTTNRGRFIRGCPGTRHYECCRYMILHVGTYCPLDCAYCILQTFFHPPILQYFVNHGDMLSELDQFFQTTPHRRIGTGEYTDSLIWARWTTLVENLVTRFGRQSRVALELKTKTNLIDNLNNLDHNRKTILAWSLNTDAVIRENEIGTATLTERLDAAACCQAWGYPLAFHFDPIIISDGAEDEYGAVIHQLFRRIDPDNIVWISLGTMRCMPPLKAIMHRRFPQSRIMYGEFIAGLDDKLRYYKPLRIKIYGHIISAIRKIAPGVPLYFCMESNDVWEQALGFTPEAKGGLATLLDASAIKQCHLNSA